MHSEALTPATQRVLTALGESGLTKEVYLAGGSALALCFGHRFSVDLDWFGEDVRITDTFRQQLLDIGKLVIHSTSTDTFHGTLGGVEISFFRYPYALIAPKKRYAKNIYLASERDIACMKLDAVATRGSRKDFVDLYFLLQHYDFAELFGFMREKYSGLEYNTTHLLKSLVFFDDAQKSPMPNMIAKVEWHEMKSEIEKKVKAFVAASAQ